MKKISQNNKIKTAYANTCLKKLFLLIPIFLLSFSLFITCIKLIQKKTIYSDYANNSDNDLQAVPADSRKLRQSSADGSDLQSSLADNVIRLHVIANSDSDADQKLKYKVRDAIIETLRLSLADVKNMDEAERIINSKLPAIERTAQDTIEENGYICAVNAKICDREFPVKTYGDLTFPEGEYRALCVEIGEAKGKNWWCVLFPSLCFVDSTTAVVPDSSKKLLREKIGETDYNKLEEYSKATQTPNASKETKQDDETELEVHSAIYDWICSRLK